MSEKLSKCVLGKELQIYTTWTLASFQFSIPVYILGAIFGEERFESEENARLAIYLSIVKFLHFFQVVNWQIMKLGILL